MRVLEASTGVEPIWKVLQTSALPLGQDAIPTLTKTILPLILPFSQAKCMPPKPKPRQAKISTSTKSEIPAHSTNFFSIHGFFSSAFLLFLVFITQQVFSLHQDFKQNDTYISLYLALTALFVLIKVFLYGFTVVEAAYHSHRWFILIFHALSTSSMIWLTFLALFSLTTTNYPSNYFLYSMIASGIFVILSFLNQSRSLSFPAAMSFGYSCICYTLLALLVFQGDYVFLQVIGFIALVTEVSQLILTSKFLVSKLPSVSGKS
jgi:hypothetical protein